MTEPPPKQWSEHFHPEATAVEQPRSMTSAPGLRTAEASRSLELHSRRRARPSARAPGRSDRQRARPRLHASRRRRSGSERARSRNETTPPMGFGASRRNQRRESLTCRFASPTPSALGVSHSLSGLILPEPRGFVSRHIRPQASGLQSFSRATSRNTSRCPLLSCRRNTSPIPGRTRIRASAPGFRAFLRSSVRHPCRRV
jgi:hypothetical protein